MKAINTTVVVYVRDELGDVFHWSANNPEFLEAAKQGCCKYLTWVRRPAYKGRKPCGRCEIVVEEA